MKVTVFGSRLSPFVEKVVRGLQLKGVGFELVEPQPNAKDKTTLVTDLIRTGEQPSAVALLHWASAGSKV